jgi:presenilin-like A22 family membrane protease
MEPNTEQVTIMDMDLLTAFGLFAVIAMLVFYALEDRNPWYVLAFAGACALASIYGFLQGAWPFGIVEAVWTLIAVRRWQVKSSSTSRTRVTVPDRQ